MRQLVIGIGLVMLTAACASPWANKKRTVTQKPPRVVYTATPPAVNTTTATDGEYTGTYPMAGGGEATSSDGTSTTATSGEGAQPASQPAFQKNPVPGSAREYINRHSNGGAMAK